MKRLVRYSFLLVAMGLIATACGSLPAATPPPATQVPELAHVSLRLQWFPQYQFAGYIVAKEKGFYQEQGLDVTIQPGGPGTVSLPLVASGSDTFGSTGAGTIFLAREQGVKVVSLATIFQTSPVGFMVHKDSGIVSPQDFLGRTVGVFYGDNVETEYRALLAATHVDRTHIIEVPGEFNLTSFLARRVDVWPVYITDQPNLARKEGADINLIMARDYGVMLLGDVLFTTETFAQQNPHTVQAFVNGTLRGWDYALNHLEETVKIIGTYNKDLDLDQLRFEGTQTIPLVQYGAGTPCPGWNSTASWTSQLKLMRDLTLLKQDIDVAQVVDNRFVAAYYIQQGINCATR